MYFLKIKPAMVATHFSQTAKDGAAVGISSLAGSRLRLDGGEINKHIKKKKRKRKKKGVELITVVSLC